MTEPMTADTTPDLPAEYGYAGHDAGTPLDALDDLKPGDRVLWGDRQQPCTVARIVTPDDRTGQALAASVISTSDEWLDAHDSDLPDILPRLKSWGSPTRG